MSNDNHLNTAKPVSKWDIDMLLSALQYYSAVASNKHGGGDKIKEIKAVIKSKAKG